MGFCGDAMKVTKTELDLLTQLFAEIRKQRALSKQRNELALGRELETQREQILATAQEVTAQRSKAEEIEREIARLATDLKLVEDRIAKDNKRLSESSNTKDIAGIQHELETLLKRKDVLETAEIELLEQLEIEQSALAQLAEHKSKLEALFETDSNFAKERLKLVDAELLDTQNSIGKLRASANPELLAIFDQRLERGVPIGVLRGSSCGACNMSLNSQDIASISKLGTEDLARCPECGAILVRQ